MSNEITARDVRKLDLSDVRCLLNWADWEPCFHTDDLTLPGVLALYHASSEYIIVSDWLHDDPEAQARYERIQRIHRIKEDKA